MQSSRLYDFLYDLVAAGLIVAALLVALRTTYDLPGAFDPDHFRDIAQAQTTRDGHPLSDPYFKGEWAWYNPLLAWTLALGSKATNTSIEEFHIHKGPWLNLLGPILFYALGVRLFGRRAALGALALYLFFLLGNERSWATATYSPWLFAGNFSQGLFFASALVAIWAADDLTVTRAILAGACIGLTFLAHTAPAIILSVVACALFWKRWRALTAAVVAALVVASPFLASIVWHYHLRVVNPGPITYVYDPISRSGILRTAWAHALVLALAVAGLWRMRSRAVWAWSAAALGLTLSTIFGLTPIVPAFHYWLYFTAVLALLAGRTLAFVCRPALAFMAITLALVVWNWKPYTERPDLQVGRFLAARRFREHIDGAGLLRMVTMADEVVVGTPASVRLIIGPAGRKTLAPDPLFSNPYVEYESRRKTRDHMLASFHARDLMKFSEQARANDVGAIVNTGIDDCATAAELFPLTYRTGDVCISIVQ